MANVHPRCIGDIFKIAVQTVLNVLEYSVLCMKKINNKRRCKTIIAIRRFKKRVKRQRSVYKGNDTHI